MDYRQMFSFVCVHVILSMGIHGGDHGVKGRIIDQINDRLHSLHSFGCAERHVDKVILHIDDNQYVFHRFSSI